MIKRMINAKTQEELDNVVNELDARVTNVAKYIIIPFVVYFFIHVLIWAMS